MIHSGRVVFFSRCCAPRGAELGANYWSDIFFSAQPLCFMVFFVDHVFWENSLGSLSQPVFDRKIERSSKIQYRRWGLCCEISKITQSRWKVFGWKMKNHGAKKWALLFFVLRPSPSGCTGKTRAGHGQDTGKTKMQIANNFLRQNSVPLQKNYLKHLWNFEFYEQIEKCKLLPSFLGIILS